MGKDTKLLIGIGGTGAGLTDQIKKALEKREPLGLRSSPLAMKKMLER